MLKQATTEKIIETDVSRVSGEPNMEDTREMLRLMMGFIPARAVYLFAKLDLADLLNGTPKTAQELAQSIDVDSEALYRLLRVVSGTGAIAEDDGHRFHLNQYGRTLCNNGDNSIRDYVVMFHEIVHDNYQLLEKSVRTGKTVFKDIHGLPVFDYLSEQPEARGKFIAGLGNQARIDNAAILEAYDFGESQIIADIGGGSGALISAILEKNDHLSGVLFDLPSTIQSVDQSGRLADHSCNLLGGDFFQEIPVKADTFLLKQVLHDWDDQACVSILHNCRTAMSETGKLLIVERLIGAADETPLTHNMDMTMLVATGGKERRVEEYAALIELTGFRLNRIVPTGLEVNIIEAIPA